MKQLRYRLLIMLAALMLLPTGVGAAEAQKDLKIQDVFTRYGKKRNVTMVELSNEMLETYGMTRYKSITIKDDPEALRFIRQCLEVDQRGARKIKEVTDDGGGGLRLLPASGQRSGRESFCPVQSQLQRDDHTGLYRRRIGQRRPDHPFIYQKRFINR